MIIYQVCNQVTGKLYVGYTKQTIERRWSRHCKHTYEGSHCVLHRAIQKYGRDAFTVTLLEECSEENVLDAKRRWIAKLNTMLPNGYNMTLGGDGTLGRKNSPEERARRSLAARKRFKNPLERAKMSDSRAASQKRVLQYVKEDVVEYASLKAAERVTGVPRNHIRDVCLGRRYFAGGFVWRFQDLYVRDSSPLPSPPIKR